MVDDGEDNESQQSVHNDPKVWGRMVALMQGLDFVCFTKNEYKFGRSGSCDVRFKDPRISGTHCRIYRKLKDVDSQEFDVFIVDSSANGTYVNGMRLKKNKPVKLESSDKVSLAIRKSKSKQPQIAVYMFQECDIGSKDHIGRKYELRKVLGTGACGQVVEGIERETGKRYAVKIIEKKRLAQNSGGVVSPDSLLREAEILKKVNHTNITMFKELYQTPKVIYIVMEYVGGGELLDHILQRGHYSEPETAAILSQMLNAVNYLHSRNIVHRDLKPENILLVKTNDDGEEEYDGEDFSRIDPLTIKITDFGLAKFLGNEGLRTYCGTPQYFAPEVLSRKHTVMGQGRYGKAVDMWSIGVILYVLLCGVPPFEDDVLFEQIEGADFDKTCERWSKISSQARDLISKLLIKSPIKRLTALDALKHPFLGKNLEKYYGRTSMTTNSTIDTSTEEFIGTTSISDENDVSATGQILLSNTAHTKRKRDDDGGVIVSSCSSSSGSAEKRRRVAKKEFHDEEEEVPTRSISSSIDDNNAVVEKTNIAF